MKYCSLGHGCHSANILKRLGLKKESYPFDWLNSRTSIVKDCIEDNFKKFLDKKYYSNVDISIGDNNCCQHELYGSHITQFDNEGKNIVFRHRNPLVNIEDYKYYQRCIERFRLLLSSKEEKCFLIMYPNRDNDISESIKDALLLVDFLENYTTNFRLVAIHHQFTGQNSHSIIETKKLKFFNITTITKDEGGNFLNEHDNNYISNLINDVINEY